MPVDPTFWNDRYGRDGFAYGEAANAFLAEQAERLPSGGRVLELGAGEGRNAAFLAAHGFVVTALDFSAEGLAKARQLARSQGAEIETIRADVTAWAPERTWDAVVMTFLHLPASARPALFGLAKACVAPGGVLVGEWFRPEQLTESHPSGGPKSIPMLVAPEELRSHFGGDESDGAIVSLESADSVLDEGPYHQGSAATVRLVWQRVR